MIWKLKDMGRAEVLFSGGNDTFVRACLEGIMGDVYGNHRERPSAVLAAVGDFSFFAGTPDRELLTFPTERRGPFRILVPENVSWEQVLEETFGERAVKITRYRMRPPAGGFDMERLSKAVSSLPEGFSLEEIKRKQYEACRREEWSRDLTGQFEDYASYERLGAGVWALKGKIPAAGASSYVRYRDGIEIEIDTKEEFRRKGLAFACGAALILSCLERKLEPSWDAHNRESAALAKKLGYDVDCEYTAYEIWG